MFPIKIPFLDAKEKMAKSIVAGRIRSIGQKEGIRRIGPPHAQCKIA
jgi:hypothetical protein